MNQNRAFGVGFFHFGYNKKLPYYFSSETFLDDLQEALLSISSLSDYEYRYWEELSKSFAVTDAPPNLEDDQEYFPKIPGLELRFRLYIPYRIQMDLFPNENRGSRTTTEVFQVSIHETFYGPFTIVECVNAAEDCHPSSAVSLVREYLRSEFKRLTTSIQFECLGPSPFHANFFLVLDPGFHGEYFELEEKVKRGYNDLNFKYGKKYSSDDALLLLIEIIDIELGLFYFIKRQTVSLMKQGERLSSNWMGLQTKISQKISVFNLRARVRIHGLAHSLVSEAYKLQVDYSVIKHFLEKDIATTYSKGLETYLEKYIRGAYAKHSEYPVESILKWAEYAVGNSLKFAEITAVILSAICGGVVGALLTSAMSS